MEQLRKAVQAALECLDAGVKIGPDSRLHDWFREALSASQPAEIAEPAPDLPDLPIGERAELWRGDLVVHPDATLLAYGQQCYAAGLAANNREHADLLVTLEEQQEEINALREREEAYLAAKRAPMTRALDEYNEHTKGEPEQSPLEALRFFCSLSMKPQDWLDAEPFFARLEASSGLTLAQAREMALDVQPATPSIEIESKGDEKWMVGFEAGTREYRANIEAAFKEPT